MKKCCAISVTAAANEPHYIIQLLIFLILSASLFDIFIFKEFLTIYLF